MFTRCIEEMKRMKLIPQWYKVRLVERFSHRPTATKEKKTNSDAKAPFGRNDSDLLPPIASAQTTIGNGESLSQISTSPESVAKPIDRAPGINHTPDDLNIARKKLSEQLIPIFINIDCKEASSQSFANEALNNGPPNLGGDLCRRAEMVEMTGMQMRETIRHANYDQSLSGQGVSHILQYMGHWNNPTRRQLNHWYRLLAIVAVISYMILLAAAVETWAPYMRIGAGFSGFTLGLAAIPLRRDERVNPTSLIPSVGHRIPPT